MAIRMLQTHIYCIAICILESEKDSKPNNIVSPKSNLECKHRSKCLNYFLYSITVHCVIKILKEVGCGYVKFGYKKHLFAYL